MTWGFFGAITVVAIVAAWYMKTHGMVGAGLTLPSGFGSHTASISMTGLQPYVALSLPTTVQGAAMNLGGGNTAAPAPYWVSVTLDGQPVDIPSASVTPLQVNLPITKASGTIVAVYVESASLGWLSLQSVIPQTTCTITYGP